MGYNSVIIHTESPVKENKSVTELLTQLFLIRFSATNIDLSGSVSNGATKFLAWSKSRSTSDKISCTLLSGS